MQEYLEYYKDFVLTYTKNSNGEYVPIVLSKLDNCRCGDSFSDLNWLLDLGINQSIQNHNNEEMKPCNLGFSPSHNAWFVWTGNLFEEFTIGSTVTKEDMAYVPSNKTEFINKVTRIYDQYNNDSNAQVTYISKENEIEVTVGWSTKGFTKVHEYPTEWGRGEWTAKNIQDAKQMAIDYLNNLNKIIINMGV